MPDTCPVPITRHTRVQLAHGGGGAMMQRLIQDVFLKAFGGPAEGLRHDGARLDVGAGRLAFTTDSYVVSPLFFPGGDIGTLAVNGTVNDLAMCGARPLCLSAGFILEEGLGLDVLERVVASMRDAARAAGVEIVTGDTKVVDHGRADGMYVNTAGLGVVEAGSDIAPARVAPGDCVILSGDVARHGIAVMAVREGLEFEGPVTSDCAPLADAVAALIHGGIDVHCMRDLTRGGLASALIEISEAAGWGLRLEEERIPVLEPVRAACEMLGFDPIYVANEGRFVSFVPAPQADRAVELLRSVPVSRHATLIGRVEAVRRGPVLLRSRIGAVRVVDLLSGEQLPRIC